MPTYFFKCPGCLFELVAMASMSAEKRCPDCDSVLERMPIANIGGFTLKGQGFENNGRV